MQLTVIILQYCSWRGVPRTSGHVCSFLIEEDDFGRTTALCSAPTCAQADEPSDGSLQLARPLRHVGA